MPENNLKQAQFQQPAAWEDIDYNNVGSLKKNGHE